MAEAQKRMKTFSHVHYNSYNPVHEDSILVTKSSKDPLYKYYHVAHSVSTHECYGTH
jgi:hypothetical protein